MDTLRPESWGNNYELPERNESELSLIIHELMEDLFHQTDEQAKLIKSLYLEKYPFLNKDYVKDL